MVYCWVYHQAPFVRGNIPHGRFAPRWWHLIFYRIDDHRYCCPPIYIYIHTYIDHSCFDLVPLPDTARGISAEVESCQSSDRIRQVVGFIPKIGCCWRICWLNMWRLRVDLGLVSRSFKIIGTPKFVAAASHPLGHSHPLGEEAGGTPPSHGEQTRTFVLSDFPMLGRLDQGPVGPWWSEGRCGANVATVVRRFLGW